MSTPKDRPAAKVGKAERTAETDRRVQGYAHYAAGVIQDLSGEAGAAGTNFLEAARADLRNERLVLDVAQRFLERRQPEQALQLLKEASADPKSPGVFQGWLGLTLAQMGRNEEAIAESRVAIQRAPKLLLSYQTIARLHLQKGQTNEALAVLEQAFEQRNANATFLVDLADLYAAGARTKMFPMEKAKSRVLELLASAEKLGPSEPILLQKMAEAYKLVGDLASATKIYRGLLDDAPEARQGGPGFTPYLREQLIQLYLRTGDRGEAVTQLKQVIRENPTNPQAYYMLGALAAEEKNYAEAAGHYQKALLLNPEMESAYYDLASLQISLNQPKEALATLTLARGRFAANFFLEFYTGIAHVSLKEYDDAVRFLTSAELMAKTSDPSRLNAIFYFQLGAAYERRGNFEEGEKHLRKCLEMNPDFDEAQNYLGYMWADRGVNLEEALKLVEQALKKEPRNAAYLDSLAWVYYRLRRFEDALQSATQAVALSEDPDATLFDHLGDILSSLGRAEDARAAWEKSLQVEPNEAIKRKLEGIKGRKD